MKEYHIVWNEAKTEGFITTDKQLAYEVRKGADTNCYHEDGKCSHVGVAFCTEWVDDDCTTETVRPDDLIPVRFVIEGPPHYSEVATLVMPPTHLPVIDDEISVGDGYIYKVKRIQKIYLLSAFSVNVYVTIHQ